MRRIFLCVLFLLIVVPVNAERWICYDNTTKAITKRVVGDCKSLGLCSGFNNTGLQANCFEAKEVEFNDAKKVNLKVDELNGTNRIINKSAEEIAAEDLAKQTAVLAAETSRVEAFDVSAKDAFTAFIKVYNSKVPAGNRVTKEEIVDQIKLDKGL